ncbi:hypothetical protein [Bdellovibrio reynosensis]|uniref:Uncharacterized protein n=1 Tax=Bdellovibrio reynosensis TaxID=2835041 RepID=A0ABY4CC19_9BACT|nr:hypothetical protein [Bdellovibrio reynosensis]UOF02388.1 hypothetical protein MNR06_05415 [Bdellovibrio reynosensis]
MKQTDVVKVLGSVLGATSVDEVNKALKAKENATVKFKIMGKSLGYLGFTGVVKAVTDDGVKVVNVNKVSLIKFSEIESFEKAKPKTERHTKPRALKVVVEEEIEIPDDIPEGTVLIFDEPGEGEFADLRAKKHKPKKKMVGKSGSKFIPKPK